MFNSICFYHFIEYYTIYINVFLKMSLGLGRTAFSGIFVTVCFLIILLLPKQTIPTKKKLTKRKKYKSGPKTNTTFFILHHSLLMIFLVLLSNKTKQPKDTSTTYNCIKSSNFFSLNFLKILDITTNSFLRCYLSYFALAKIRLLRYDSFFRFILLLSGDINVNPGPATVNNNKVS